MHLQRQNQNAEKNTKRRAVESPEQRDKRKKQDAEHTRINSPELGKKRKNQNAEHKSKRRAVESPEQRKKRQKQDAEHTRINRA